jgi:hypothetical protein
VVAGLTDYGKELQKIVLTGKQDIRYNRNLGTYEGARKWAKNKSYTARQAIAVGDEKKKGTPKFKVATVDLNDDDIDEIVIHRRIKTRRITRISSTVTASSELAAISNTDTTCFSPTKEQGDRRKKNSASRRKIGCSASGGMMSRPASFIVGRRN